MAERGGFGARVYLMDTDMVYVCQTVKRGAGENAPYVIDQKPTGRDHGRKFVEITDDKGMAEAIRAALHGSL